MKVYHIPLDKLRFPNGHFVVDVVFLCLQYYLLSNENCLPVLPGLGIVCAIRFRKRNSEGNHDFLFRYPFSTQFLTVELL